jgi:hypothetical protein
LNSHFHLLHLPASKLLCSPFLVTRKLELDGFDRLFPGHFIVAPSQPVSGVSECCWEQTIGLHKCHDVKSWEATSEVEHCSCIAVGELFLWSSTSCEFENVLLLLITVPSIISYLLYDKIINIVSFTSYVIN